MICTCGKPVFGLPMRCSIHEPMSDAERASAVDRLRTLFGTDPENQELVEALDLAELDQVDSLTATIH